ncbi:hypothetical protein [Profundibacterium mesophilum]|uniref:Uncharacterized protein n=1 Tax=Profundibacterium mesophilum KAUST100406-0324 TaxID=1037889 RepID=A0A921NW69_9RHOB|nr:hypothetical protein [Profundibacterium mesophilum]KAF0676788.1 hypothetical protein PMES_00875 [Profundibacterium mesophilum KAUST100406-0324]
MDIDWLFSVLDDLETLAWEHRLDDTALQIWKTRRVAERNIIALAQGAATRASVTVSTACAEPNPLLH